MINPTGNLEPAARAGQAGVSAAAAQTARAMTGVGGQRDFEAPMAQAVRHELFTEALLAAAHSRLEELKTVATGNAR